MSCFSDYVIQYQLSCPICQPPYLPTAMPASRVSKSVTKKKPKEYAKEVKFVEKQGKTGGIGFVAVDVSTSSTPPSASASPTRSRQSTHPTSLHKMDVDDPNVTFNNPQAGGSSKKSKKSTKVLSFVGCAAHLLIINYTQIHDNPLSSWLELRDQYLAILLQDEALSSKHCHMCKGDDHLYRCKDCFGSPVCCKACLLHTHISAPFHRIQHWNGEFFQSTKLMDLGYLLHLGHGGQACPHSNSASETVICVVDITGVFHHKLRWCCCQDADPSYAQLLRLGLYPASIERPQTAFTFSLLDYFHIDALECKTSASNFYNKLRRFTNSLFPHHVPVSFAILLSCDQIYNMDLESLS